MICRIQNHKQRISNFYPSFCCPVNLNSRIEEVVQQHIGYFVTQNSHVIGIYAGKPHFADKYEIINIFFIKYDSYSEQKKSKIRQRRSRFPPEQDYAVKKNECPYKISHAKSRLQPVFNKNQQSTKIIAIVIIK